MKHTALHFAYVITPSILRVFILYNENVKDAVASIDIAYRLLRLYDVAGSGSSDDIKNFKRYKSKLFGMQDVFSFDYHNKHYSIINDYSLMDNPKYIRDVIEEINPHIKGRPLKNPIPQSDGALYASGLNGTEYYLWEEPSK